MQELSPEEKIPKLGAELADISRERDITRYYSLPLLIPQDEVLNRNGYGIETLKIYERLLENAQIRACYQQRFRKLTKCQWEVNPASQSKSDVKAADWLRELCENMPMDSITEQMLYGVHYGYSVAEKMLIRSEGMITLDLAKEGIRIRNRRRFRFDTDMQVRLITINNMYEGELLDPSRVWRMKFGNDNSDDPYGRGLANSLYWMDLFQRGSMRHWLNFLDNFSARNAKVQYPVGASDDEKKLALQLAIALKAGKPTAHAEGLIAEIIEAAGSGTANFEGLYDRCDAAIAKIILSQSGTTDNGAWAGTAESHENVADDVVASDGDMFSQAFMRHVAQPLSYYNFPEAKTPICRYKTKDDEDINSRAERDSKIFALGYRLTPEKFADIYGEGYERVEPQPQILAPQDAIAPANIPTQPQTPDAPPNAQFSEIRSGEIYDFGDVQNQQFPDQQALDDAIAKIQPQALQAQIEPILKPVMDLVRGAKDFNEILEGLAEAYPEMDDKKLEETPARAIFTSEVWGRLNAEQD